MKFVFVGSLLGTSFTVDYQDYNISNQFFDGTSPLSDYYFPWFGQGLSNWSTSTVESYHNAAPIAWVSIRP